MPFPNPATGMRNTAEEKRPIDEWAAFLACRPFSPGSLDRGRPDVR